MHSYFFNLLLLEISNSCDIIQLLPTNMCICDRVQKVCIDSVNKTYDKLCLVCANQEVHFHFLLLVASNFGFVRKRMTLKNSLKIKGKELIRHPLFGAMHTSYHGFKCWRDVFLGAGMGPVPCIGMRLSDHHPSILNSASWNIPAPKHHDGAALQCIPFHRKTRTVPS